MGVRPIGVNFSTAVILSAAKDLRSAQPVILSAAKDDRLKFTPMGVALVPRHSGENNLKNTTTYRHFSQFSVTE